MMSKRSYWTGRYEELAAANQAQSAQYEQHFGAMSDLLYMQMQDELEGWYRRYGRTTGTTPDEAAKTLENARSQDWKMTLDQYRQMAIQGGHDDVLDQQYIQSRVARMQQLQAQLKKQAGHAVPTFDKDMEAELSKGYKRTYEHATYLNEQNGAVSTKADFAHYDEAALNAILHKPWAKDGKNFSKRIWGNMQDKLPDMLMESLAESVVLGHSVDQVVNRLSLKYGDFKRVNLHRLIQSEMAHIEENATFDSYADCDVEYYKYMATLESRTCDMCAALDGKVVKVIDRVDGGNYPPIHPHCRCTTGAWFPEVADLLNKGERWSRDPETGKVEQVDGQTFNQWWANKVMESEQHKSAQQYGANINYVRSSEFNTAVKSNALMRANSRVIVSTTQTMLKHRNGTPFEDIALISNSSHEVAALYDGSRTPQSIDHYPNSMKAIFKSGKRNGYTIIHNHPESTPPSPADILSMQRNHKGTVSLGIIAGHDGTMYTYTRPTKTLPNIATFTAVFDAAFTHELVGSETDRTLAAWKKVGDQYGFEVKEAVKPSRT
ncbi:minor capsid protein [Lacticaseibacillus pabuli]|uniref:Minor capsid protein n=1 Tax=Lacticaseibacillus pabuli TaxID=3025672 RepID=A0ABY7WTY8_9LACO|nr:minor capsid protein [Lacticaseibacillus sp. KACC 23028]WDF83624.1 minor capsid protein [Lacticaseibacillus sp. KACC 23028]